MQQQKKPAEYPQAGPAAPSSAFESYSNYVALPMGEAFRIEYWALEEAKLRRQPPEKPLSRRVAMIVGGGSGIGREAALLAGASGATVAVADRNVPAAEAVVAELRKSYGRDAAHAIEIDITQEASIRAALRSVIANCGGLDLLINTAALFPASADNTTSQTQWGKTLEINVTANYFLAEQAAHIFREQGLDASIVLTSSANAVVAKRGSEAYDVSKAAVSHLVRELAVSLAPLVRVNGISPATVIRGSTMFPRERVIASLKKYNISFDASVERRRTAQSSGGVLRAAYSDASADRSGRLRASGFIPCRARSALYHRTHCSSRWRPDRGFPAVKLPADRRAIVAVDLGAQSCRVSLLRWLPDGPRIQLVHRVANAPVESRRPAPLESFLALLCCG